MVYFFKIINKELKSWLGNKKIFMFTLIAQILITVLIIRSKDEFDNSGFHSVGMVLSLIILLPTLQFCSESFYLDKETGIWNLLVLSKRIKKNCYARIVLYSIVMLFVMKCPKELKKRGKSNV